MPEEMREIVVSLANDVCAVNFHSRAHYRLFTYFAEEKPSHSCRAPFQCTRIKRPLYPPTLVGIYAIKGELEDLSLKFTEPEIFNP